MRIKYVLRVFYAYMYYAYKICIRRIEYVSGV